MNAGPLGSLLADQSNRGRLLATAAHQLLTIGYDAITVNGLASEAGVARGTVYAYFGDVPGVFATIWAETGEAWLRHVLHPAYDTPATDHDRVMLQLLALERRSAALREVVQPDVQRVWAEVEAAGAVHALRAAWMLSLRIGLELSGALSGDRESGHFFVALAAQMPDDAAERVGLAGVPVPGEPALRTSVPSSAPDDSVSQRLVAATMQVVGSAGLAAASMMRICRVARLSTGAANPRFRSLQELHDFTFNTVMSEVVDSNAEQLTLDASPADQNAEFAVASLNADRRAWRNYRQEIGLAAIHDAAMADRLRNSFNTTNAVLLAKFVKLAPNEVLAQLAVQFNVIGSFGLSAAHELGLPLRHMDHRIALRWMFSTAEHM
jgi:AcrR family transcriptional regulator